MEFYKHQNGALKETKDKNRVAYFHPMGSGKTFTGAEKMIRLGAKFNLIICQKSKIEDWIEHFKTNYPKVKTFDLTKRNAVPEFLLFGGMKKYKMSVGVINYELAFRRSELAELRDFTLMLDESSLIQNENAKRSKFALKLGDKAANVILLSGTPVGGRYERLISQMHLLGWNISKTIFYNQYIDYHYEDVNGFPLMVIDGYKNVDRLKRKMRDHGCHFLTQDELFDLPDQVHQTIRIHITKDYKEFRKTSICILHYDAPNGRSPVIELVGDTTLTKMLYERQLCGQYNRDKLEAFADLVNSTEDRLIVFYNFNAELEQLQSYCESLGRCYSVVNGKVKDLDYYYTKDNSVTFIQYQAGAMGLNLQLANKIIYFTPPLSSELFEQSKKRVHRIRQTRTCYYYYLTCTGSVEEKIYKTLAMRKDYTEKLFEKGD